MDELEQFVLQRDFAGYPRRRISLSQVNQKLVAAGWKPILEVHHDIIARPGDRLALLGFIARTLVDVQGLGEKNVLGDAIVVLGPDLEVEWFWPCLRASRSLRIARTSRRRLMRTPGRGRVSVPQGRRLSFLQPRRPAAWASRQRVEDQPTLASIATSAAPVSLDEPTERLAFMRDGRSAAAVLAEDDLRDEAPAPLQLEAAVAVETTGR